MIYKAVKDHTFSNGLVSIDIQVGDFVFELSTVFTGKGRKIKVHRDVLDHLLDKGVIESPSKSTKSASTKGGK